MNKHFVFLTGFLLLFFQGWGQDSLLTIQQAVESAYNRNAELQQLHAQLLQKENMWKTETEISTPEISYFKEGISTGPGDPFEIPSLK